ncbi:MAG: NUDIX hydrolase [Pseudomonadota bacterium]
MSGTDKTKADTAASHTQRPRDAATLIIVDSADGQPRVLMGKRRADVVFMPGKFVFPGGRVDQHDKDVASCSELGENEVEKLLYDMKGHPSTARARAIALAGIREVFEETGLIIGRRGETAAEPVPENWQPFFASGYVPSLAQLHFFARAITPPGRPRRYDTRFFCIPSDCIAHDTGQPDEELSEIGWYTIEAATQLDLPPITRVVLEDLHDHIQSGLIGPSRQAVPYYHQRHGNFFRELIKVDS